MGYNGKNGMEVHKMKRLRVALKNKSNWPSLVTLALIVACSLFSFWDTKFAEQARSAAFALVAVEFFIMLVVHLEEVKGALREIGNNASKSTQLRTTEEFLTSKIITGAKEELFFCGWALSWLTSHRGELLAVSDNVRVRILAMDLDDETARNACVSVFGRPPGLSSLSHLDWFSSKRNFEIRVVKFPVSMHFSASDMRMATGSIQVSFQEYGRIGLNTPCATIESSSTEWYDFYRNQIELFWEQGTLWTSST